MMTEKQTQEAIEDAIRDAEQEAQDMGRTLSTAAIKHIMSKTRRELS